MQLATTVPHERTYKTTVPAGIFLTADRFEILQGVMGQEGAATVSWQSLAARL